MANDWPSRSSTSVSARRVFSAGMRKPGEHDAVVEVERAHLGPQLEADDVAGNRRREVQPHAEFLVLDGHLAREARDQRDRNLAAGQEAGLLAVVGNQVRLGEALEESAALQRLQHAADALARDEEEDVQEVGEHESPLSPRRSPAPGTAAWSTAPAKFGAVGEQREARLLQRVAVDLGEADLQHHLLARRAARQLQHVDHRVLRHRRLRRFPRLAASRRCSRPRRRG